MAIRIELVRYGRDAAGALRRTVALAKGDDPLAPVSIIVPSNHVGVATRRLVGSGALGPLASRGIGIAAISFLTPYRLAELLGSSRLASNGLRPVSTPVIAAALRASLAERPGIFAPVAAHPATEAALVSAYRELRDVAAGDLDSLAKRSPRAADVVRLHQSARARLTPRWYDEEDLISAAIETLRTDDSARGGLGSVVVYLPQRLSRHSAQLLKAVAERSEVVVLAGTTGDVRADSEVAKSLRRLDRDGGIEPRSVAVESLAMVGADRTKIVTVSDSDEEVRAATRAVVDAVRTGTALDRIAILHASPEPYARLVHEQLAAAGIVHNGSAVMPLTARVAGRTLLDLLALPEGGFRRDDVFAWLAGARLLSHGRWAPVTAWERLSRDAGVVAERGEWDTLLATFAEDRDASASRSEADPDAPPWRAERARADAVRARELREFILALIDDLAAAGARPRSWSERSNWARRHLDALLGTETHRASWPPAEQRAAERVERALDRLACLDAVEDSVAFDVFARTLALELDADLGRVGRMGEGVLVGSVGMGIGLDLDLVVVLGLAEGLFPASSRDDSLLPDHEREAIGEALALRADRIEREHHEFLAALAGATRQLLCVPRGDLRRNSERVPSRWVLQVASAIAGHRLWPEELLGYEQDWVEHVASFDAGLRRVQFPATSQEYRLRSLMAEPLNGASRSVLTASGDAALEAGASVLAARRSDRFTRFDGNLAGLVIPSPADRVTSATRLENWASCPFAYLFGDVLGVGEVENPEDQLQISPHDRGSLVHDVLERFIDEVLARPVVDQPDPSQAWSESDRVRVAEIAEIVCDDYEAHGLTGRPIFWRRDKKQILAELVRFLRVDSDHRSSHRTRPVAAELAFGLPDARLGTVALRLPDGRSVNFRGKADRVDVAEDSTIHVVDYKTGSASSYKDLSEDDPDLGGRKLQLAVYGQAARLHQNAPDAPVRAEYWFVSNKGNFERVGYAVTPAVLERVGESVASMVAGIESGVFPHFPTATSTTPWVECPFCDPDGLGVIELRGQFERKLQDPAMALFVDLVTDPNDSDLDVVAEEVAGA